MHAALKEAEVSYNEGNHVRVSQILGPLHSDKRSIDTPSLVRLGVSLTKLEQFPQALSIFRELAIKDRARGLVFLKMALNLAVKINDHTQVFDVAREILASEPTNQEARTHYRHLLRRSFSYDEISMSDKETLQGFRAEKKHFIEAELPHDMIMWCGDEDVFAKFSSVINKDKAGPIKNDRRNLGHLNDEKIRVGYFTSDLSEYHATICLMNRMFDLHDPERFDVRIYDISPDEYVQPNEGVRTRNAGKLYRIADLSNEKAVELVRSHRLDIAVDLKGHTENARSHMFNDGLAPVQVAYLGFPGPGLGIDCDYIICDRIVCPPESQKYYGEKFCWMPDSYQVNDNFYRHHSQKKLKSEVGLPEDKLVFVSANNPKKITEETLKLWARVLCNVPNSVLWLICDSNAAKSSIEAYLGKKGVEKSRIIHAPRIGIQENLDRLTAADIGLDTFPCNGHTTTSDKLWSGVPVVTKRGTNFASRVSESLLAAVHLPELTAADDDAFVAICSSLAADRNRLSAIKDRLLAERENLPLFDTERFVRHLEDAYRIMVERSLRMEGPELINIDQNDGMKPNGYPAI